MFNGEEFTTKYGNCFSLSTDLNFPIDKNNHIEVYCERNLKYTWDIKPTRKPYMFDVIIHKDAIVYRIKGKNPYRDIRYSVDKYTISNGRFIWSSYKDCKKIVKQNPLMITHVMDQTEDICIDALKQSVCCFGSIHKQYQTHNVCIEALKINGTLLSFIDNPTEEMCIIAIKSHPDGLTHVKNQTRKICLEAVKNNGMTLRHVRKQNLELMMEAVKQNGFSLQFAHIQTPENCLEAVKQNGLALQFVKMQTPHICLEAVKNNPWSIKFVNDQTEELCTEAVRLNGRVLFYVREQTLDMCRAATHNFPISNKFVKSRKHREILISESENNRLEMS